MEGSTNRRDPQTLNGEAFDRLLSAFDPDRVRAGEVYERLRVKLTFFFQSHGCGSPSELVDATFDRAAQKVVQLDGEPIRDAAAFVHRVAQFLLKEWYRAPGRQAVAWEDSALEPAVANQEELAERERIHAA